MATLRSAKRMELGNVAAWCDDKGRWHVVCDDPDLKGSSAPGLHLRVGPMTMTHQNLTAAFQKLTSS